MKNQIKMYLFTILDSNNQIFEIRKTCTVNPLYLICRKLNGYSEEINKSKYLTLVPTN